MKTKTILVFIVFLIGGLFFGYTLGSYTKAHTRSGDIEKVLQENCKCESATQTIYSKGIQFSSSGISTEKGLYSLTGFDFSIPAKEEAERLNNILKKEIKNYDKVDLLELTFENNNQEETVIIKNGKIQ